MKLETPALLSELYVGNLRSVSNIVTNVTVPLNHLCRNLRPLVTYRDISRSDEVSFKFCDHVSSSDTKNMCSRPLNMLYM